MVVGRKRETTHFVCCSGYYTWQLSSFLFPGRRRSTGEEAQDNIIIIDTSDSKVILWAVPSSCCGWGLERNPSFVQVKPLNWGETGRWRNYQCKSICYVTLRFNQLINYWHTNRPTSHRSIVPVDVTLWEMRWDDGGGYRKAEIDRRNMMMGRFIRHKLLL